GAVTVAEADPANPRGQALERDALLRHVEPAMQVPVLREQLLHRRVGLEDILRIAGERGPAEWSDAATEQRADIGRYEAGKIERVLDTLILRDLTDVVAVVDRRNALLREIEHRADMLGD